MSLQFIFGPSGAGKSQYVYTRMIQSSLEHPELKYILLVPEQYSMALQRKMVMLHPRGGTMNIDVIGFNRLAYRVFDELNVKPSKVLEDFGKTMLIRQVAGYKKDELSVYGGCLDKSGFIDEVKSLMSEMYQYDISGDRLKRAMEALSAAEGGGLLQRKLKDMCTIFEAFEERIRDTYIVAEQMTELLAQYVDLSQELKNSVVVMDGFTGFTPIQLGLIKRLIARAREVQVVLTIDYKSYQKRRLAEHELFYLTRQTHEALLGIAEEMRVQVKEDIFIGQQECARWKTGEAGSALQHLERNLFRYPYEKYQTVSENIRISEYDTPRRELMGIAANIRKLVMYKGYRYKDIAIISGNLEGTTGYVEQLFPLYDIPYFLDYSRPIKNNSFVDAVGHALKAVEDNFSYDSMFAFLKSGVLSELSHDEIEQLENYVLAKGLRGVGSWKRKFGDEVVEETRLYVMELLLPFYEKVGGAKPKKVRDYVSAVVSLMQALDYEARMAELGGLYDKLCAVLDKLLEIMPEDEVEIGEFNELLDLGLKELTLGMIPNMLDMVIVGDITRTRLDEIKVLFVLGVNDGIIPKKGTPAQIISDREKEILAQEYELTLAPTEKMNAYVEQFYLYMNMTKPKEKLYLSYTRMSSANESMRPSYIIGRIRNIFPKLSVTSDRDDRFCLKNGGEDDMYEAHTSATGVAQLVRGLRLLMDGADFEEAEAALELYRLYMERGEKDMLDRVERALNYNNIPENLTQEVSDLIRLKFTSQSVSRLEQYAGCAYSYFLKYTVGLRERDIRGIDDRNIGNILHSAMEKMFRHVHDNLDNDWSVISDDDRDEMAGRFVEQAFCEEYDGQQLEDGRYLYLKNMLCRVGRRTAQSLCRIADGSSLKPEYFEYRFTESLTFGQDGHRMTLRGIIDRADIYYDKSTERLLLRVIDYKSGKHEFKLSELYEGLQLQLAIYTDIMRELAEQEYKCKAVPEGMYYYQMKDPYIEAEDDADAEEKRTKELKLRGFDDSKKLRSEGMGSEDVFEVILGYARKKACDIAEQIASGHIGKEPVRRAGRAVCEYCAYADVCRFDDKYGGNRYRYLKYKESDKGSIFAEMAQSEGGNEADCAGGNGYGMDRRTKDGNQSKK